MKILLMIPAYNEEKNIEAVYSSIKEHRPDVDAVVINDGSIDETDKICKKNNIPCISLPFNLGIGGAVQAGYQYAMQQGYDIAVQFDGDGQHDIEYLDAITADLIEGKSDICIGSRFVGERKGFQSTAIRRLGIMLISWLIWILTGGRLTDPTSGFRAANVKSVSLFAKSYPTDYPEPESAVLAMKHGLMVSEAPVKMKERQNGKSSINAMRSVYYMIKVSLAIVLVGAHKRRMTNFRLKEA